ncbi:MAG: ATP synthase F0 subunit B [Acidobacteriota bacterium]|nr:ATP synthase F0 subunit B [Acidobacteriota bacterium]
MLFALAGGAIQLVPDGTIIFHLLLIILMVALLNATLLNPINRILEERDRRTKGRLSEAETILQKVEERLAHHEARLRQARAEAYSVMEKQRLNASAERERKLSQVRSEVGSRVADEKAKLQRAAEEVKADLASESRNIALDISRRILGRPIAAQPSA